jgi:hypothetical protein
VATQVSAKPTVEEQLAIFNPGELECEKLDVFTCDVVDSPIKTSRPFSNLGARFLATLSKQAKADCDKHAFPSDGTASLPLDSSSNVQHVGINAFNSNGSEATAVPAFCPNPSRGFGSQNLWIDAQMYRAPEAPYYEAQMPSQMPIATPAFSFIVMQPMLLPVSFGSACMQVSPFEQQPFFSDAPTAISPVDEVQPSGEIEHMICQDVNGGEVRPWCSPTSEDRPHRQPRSRRSGGARKKKVSEKMEELRCEDKNADDVLDATCDSSSCEASQALESIACADTRILPENDMNAGDKVSQDMADPVQDELSSPLQSSKSDYSEVSSEGAVDPLILELEDADETRRQSALAWVISSFWPLALTNRGCRVVQKAIEVGSAPQKQELLEHLYGRVSEAIKSPHANHVLQKFIEILPPEHVQFVMVELKGEALQVARHRFGVRILQRMLEHCSPLQTKPLIEEILSDAASLCRHQYGNFVIQHILQHGSPEQRSFIADVIRSEIVRFAKHRIASHVVSCAMVHCPLDDVERLMHAVQHDAGQLADLSRREYGSFVVREVHRAARMLHAQQVA